MSENQTETKPVEANAEVREPEASQPPKTTDQPPLKQEKPAAEQAAQQVPTEAKKEAPQKEEPPFTTDKLQNCTSRFTRKAWDIFLEYNKDMALIRTRPIRATLTTRTTDGAEELQKQLSEAGVSEISRAEKTLSFTGTFEQLQTVIKHEQTHRVDAVRV